MSANRQKYFCCECEKPLEICICDDYDDWDEEDYYDEDWDEHEEDDWDEYDEDECPICLNTLVLCDCNEYYDEEE